MPTTFCASVVLGESQHHLMPTTFCASVVLGEFQHHLRPLDFLSKRWNFRLRNREFSAGVDFDIDFGLNLVETNRNYGDASKESRPEFLGGPSGQTHVCGWKRHNRADLKSI
jgi:hypothetical protein